MCNFEWICGNNINFELQTLLRYMMFRLIIHVIKPID